MIQVFNLLKTYGGAAPALADISFSVKDGEFVFLTGPSGAGKTTLFKILFGGEKYDRGQVLVNGVNVGKLSEENLFALRRNIGVVFQDYKLLSKKTVFENISFAQEVIGVPSETIRTRTWEVLKSVGLTPKKDAYPLQLSGGEQQRVAIARALVNNPKIILADEPTGNLDPEISLKILNLFEKINQEGKTVIFATHSLEMLRAQNHRLLTLNRGKII
ncbi:MAG: cell division ATP-binding protein FtsE [Nitrospinaceae bacterium]|jgi:cell division transport system ATP-binding protein|nr:cell division ATP-binding protein FtsE [Nitrospinaceae bacterium]